MASDGHGENEKRYLVPTLSYHINFNELNIVLGMVQTPQLMACSIT